MALLFHEMIIKRIFPDFIFTNVLKFVKIVKSLFYELIVDIVHSYSIYNIATPLTP